MPFIVVQTREDGELFITFCPEQWECNGQLFWPRSMIQGEKLRRKEDSRPGSNWSILDCEVKRRNLTLAQAKAAVKAMSDFSETEEEIEMLRSKKKKCNNETKTICLNNLAEHCIASKNNASSSLSTFTTNTIKTVQMIETEQFPTVTEQPTIVSEQPTTVTEQPTTVTEQPITVTEQPTIVTEEPTTITYELMDDVTVPESQNSIFEKVDYILSAMVVVQENQTGIQNGLERLTKKLIEVDTKFDKYLKEAQDLKNSSFIGVRPIDDKKSLMEFEEKLKKGMGSDLKSKFLAVCGVGKGKGANNCYSLIDVMFTRQFLTECSWSGGSRNENQCKVCFKAYELTFNFFFSVIQESDPSFTLKECEAFFKSILRNSNRRNNAKGLRTSSSRVRSKGQGKGKKSKSTVNTTDESQKSSSSALDTNNTLAQSNEEGAGRILEENPGPSK